MRIRMVILVLAFFTVLGNAGAQTASITLWGAVLHLGMSKEEVNAELAKHSLFRRAGGLISNRPEGEGESDIKGIYMYGGTVLSNQGKLVRILKHLGPSSDSPDIAVAVASAIYETLQSITGTSPTPCRVHTSASAGALYDVSPPIVPPMDRKETVTECDIPGGTRSVHVVIEPFTFPPDSHGTTHRPHVEITETLDARFPPLPEK